MFIGIALLNLKKIDEAIIMYDESILINPHNADTYFNRGTTLNHNIKANALVELKKFDEAIFMYNKAIELNPNHSQAYYSKGIIIFHNRYGPK